VLKRVGKVVYELDLASIRSSTSPYFVPTMVTICRLTSNHY
jgi:hypothetical protein